MVRAVADVLGVRLIPPLDVEARYTVLPDDHTDFDNTVSRAVAGHIVLCHLAKFRGTGQTHTLPDRGMAV